MTGDIIPTKRLKRADETDKEAEAIINLEKLANWAAPAADLAGLSAVSEAAALARPLADLITGALQAAGRSTHTVRAYQTSIGYFLQYLDQKRGDPLPSDWRPLATSGKESATDKRGRAYTKTLWEFRGAAAALRLVDAALLDGFRTWRESEGDNPNAASLRVYVARTFLSVAYRDGVLTHDQAQALGLKAYHQRQKRDEQPVGRRLALAEVRKLRAALNPSTQKGRRDLAILDLMLFAGLRCEETATLAAGDFRQDSGRWWIILTGKGSKTRRVKVHDVLFKSIMSWCEAAGLAIGAGSPGACLFQSVNKGDRITPECINPGVVNRIVAEYGELAGLAPGSGPNRLAPHDLRRTFARNAYDNGANLLLIQTQLGHSDPKTTARYIGAYQEDDNTAVDYVRY